MGKSIKRSAGAFASLAVASGAVLAMAPQASAGTITPTLKCVVPALGEANGPQSIQVDVTPASAAAGAKVKVKVTTGNSPIKAPIDVGPSKVTPSITFKLSSGGTATVTGAEQTIDVKKDVPQKLAPFEGDLTIPAGASGKVDLTPEKMVTKTSFGDTVCTITGGGGVVASVTVSGGATTTTGANTAGTTSQTSSGTTSQTSSGTTSQTSAGTTSQSTAGTTGSSLPKTGPLDDALSMGLVGGTVGLLGIGAVLIATRKVRASRNNAV
ncbi:hypothetical protein [Yinghuangia soli]|uniref:LPXTG cell wall anchor domain-containing protein n=1 Tax=Yinghuangia soli TaxID=2908204 RepID=A0AA41U4A1_9ACTN|nr:hypothetical protein [Yinghuangia soli]MCF2532651.1 hypothetical protein [Yinghuangia soli]